MLIGTMTTIRSYRSEKTKLSYTGESLLFVLLQYYKRRPQSFLGRKPN